MLKVVLFVVSVWTTKAYDFMDPDYNQLLFNGFESLNKDVISSRHRRDAEADPAEENECPPKNKLVCCVGDKFDREKMKPMLEVWKQCTTKLRANNSDVQYFDLFDCEKMARIKQLMICEMECYARGMNMIDETGKFNREVIKQILAEHVVGDIEWKKTVFEEYMDACLAEAESKQGEKQEQQCSSAPMNFRRCIAGKFVSGCPADLRVDSPQCNKKRDFYSQDSGNIF